MRASDTEAYRRPTQRDVARRAGVSTATVSYVLSGRRGGGAPPGAETADRVLEAAAELGYAVDRTARNLRRQRSDALAVVYRAPSSPWSDRLVEQLQARAVERGEMVVVLPVSGDAPANSVWNALREGLVDGAIVLADTPWGDADLRLLARRGVALLVVDDELEPDGFDVVRQDRLAACRAAIEHLVARRHRRIACLALPHELTEGARSPMLTSYREVLAEHGIEVDPALVHPVAGSRSDAYAVVQRLLGLPDPPTAVFSATDRAAVDGIWAARDLGFPVPDSLAVVGVGNIPEGLMISPPLTTVGAPTLDFTPLVDRLLQRVDARGALDGEVLTASWGLIERGST